MKAGRGPVVKRDVVGRLWRKAVGRKIVVRRDITPVGVQHEMKVIAAGILGTGTLPQRAGLLGKEKGVARAVGELGQSQIAKDVSGAVHRLVVPAARATMPGAAAARIDEVARAAVHGIV